MKHLLLLLALVPICSAQYAPSGFPHAVTSASFVGPLDIASGAMACYSLRACSAALRGTKAVNLCDASDAHCADALTDATTGNLIIPTSNPNCSSSGCTVKTRYDQTGGNACGGSSCDITQATIASRPTLTVNCVGGTLPCLTWSGSQVLVAANAVSFSQPVTMSSVGERTGGSFGNTFGLDNGAEQIGFGTGTNSAFIYAGSLLANTSVPDNAFHALQGLFNSTSSVLYVDGVTTSGDAGSPGSSGNKMCEGNCNNALTGLSVESIIWLSDQSANFSALNSNQHTYWGF